MKPANLSRLENGNGNPSVATLAKIAHGLGRKLEINFVKVSNDRVVCHPEV